MVREFNFYKRSLVFLLVFSMLFSLNFASSMIFDNCMLEDSMNGGTKDSCNIAGCLWASNDVGDVNNDIYDPYCGIGHCCFPNNCMQFDGNATACDEGVSILDNILNCTWDPLMPVWYPDGTQSVGGCMMDWMSSGEDSGGVEEGCWQHDGDRSSCGAQGSSCKWSANDKNQEPWCWIKSLNDAQNKNSDAVSDDIGCCETSGCWMYDGNQSNCESAFEGNCNYDSNIGLCNTKWCEEILTEDNCTYSQQNLMMPCEWNISTNLCEGMGGGGFDFYEDADSCFNAGGWYDQNGDCMMPSGDDFGEGSGGFMFAGDAHCWFADNQPNVCGNISGCAYCVAGPGEYGILNFTNNICYNKTIGLCEGHDAYDTGVYDNANNSANLICTDIEVKSACNYGPLPNCKWVNSSVDIGAYCIAGTSSDKKASPPVQYCEDPLAKNNYTLCMQLSEQYMMPCI